MKKKKRKVVKVTSLTEKNGCWKKMTKMMNLCCCCNFEV